MKERWFSAEIPLRCTKVVSVKATSKVEAYRKLRADFLDGTHPDVDETNASTDRCWRTGIGEVVGEGEVAE